MKFLNIFKSFYSQLFVYSFIQCFYLLTASDVALSSKILYTASLYSFYVLISQIHKGLLRFSLIYSLIIVVFMYPVLVIYGEPTYSVMTSVFYTDYGEAMSYIKIVPFSVYIYLLLYTIYTIYLLRIDYNKLNIRYLKYILCIGLAVLPIKKIILYDFKLEIMDRIFNVQPVRRTVLLVTSFYSIMEDHKFMKEMEGKKSTWQVEKKEGRNEITLQDNFVIVIGESVRRDFMSNYGFHIENTPFISNSNRIQFNNYISIASGTILSLTRTIALADNSLKKYELNNSIISLAKDIGYETFWVTNQGVIGKSNTPNFIIAKQSDEIYSLRKGDGDAGENPHDSEMLPLVKEIIRKNTEKPKLIVVHMQGSHVYSCDRTKNRYDEFIVSKDISCYNRSIRELDSFLSDIYKQLNSTKKSFNMVYFSDHGQVVKDGVISHGRSSYKEQYEVPLLIWGSGIKEQKQINSFRTGKDFFKLFCELNNIKELKTTKDNSYQFISEDNNDNISSYVLDTSEKIIDYNKLPSNSIEEILKK